MNARQKYGDDLETATTIEKLLRIDNMNFCLNVDVYIYPP